MPVKFCPDSERVLMFTMDSHSGGKVPGAPTLDIQRNTQCPGAMKMQMLT